MKFAQSINMFVWSSGWKWRKPRVLPLSQLASYVSDSLLTWKSLKPSTLPWLLKVEQDLSFVNKNLFNIFDRYACVMDACVLLSVQHITQYVQNLALRQGNAFYLAAIRLHHPNFIFSMEFHVQVKCLQMNVEYYTTLSLKWSVGKKM